MSKYPATKEWMSLDQIRSEYASNEYNAELLLTHLLHWAEAARPRGWKLVPIKPTQDMVDSAYDAQGEATEVAIRDAWSAMLSAAPQPMKAGT